MKIFRRCSAILAFALCSIAVPLTSLAQVPSVDPNSVIEGLPLPDLFFDRIAAENRPSQDGAEARNRGRAWLSVNDQIGTDRLVTAGLHEHDPQDIAEALNAAQYAFAHQTPDGNFADAMGYNAREQAGSVGGFTFYLAHSLLMLAQSPWFMQSAQTAQLRGQAQSLIVPFNRTLNWFIQQADLVRTDQAATNRIMSYGGDYYLAGKLLSNGEAINIGRSFIEEAIDKQRSDGTFPEEGGFDSSYQNVSLSFGQVIFLQMPPSDPLRERLWAAIQRGVAREALSVMPNGEISTVGNTRVHGGPGQHQVDSHTAVLAHAYYAEITGDPNARQAVQSILGYYFP